MSLRFLAFFTLFLYLLKTGYAIYFSFAIVDTNLAYATNLNRHQQLLVRNLDLLEKFSQLNSVTTFRQSDLYQHLTPITKKINLGP